MAQSGSSSSHDSRQENNGHLTGALREQLNNNHVGDRREGDIRSQLNNNHDGGRAPLLVNAAPIQASDLQAAVQVIQQAVATMALLVAGMQGQASPPPPPPPEVEVQSQAQLPPPPPPPEAPGVELEELERKVEAREHSPEPEVRMAAPFSPSIMDAPLPRDFRLPTIKAYTGTSDPRVHMTRYKAAMDNWASDPEPLAGPKGKTTVVQTSQDTSLLGINA
ncbi:uncharacterized protein LOC116001125 [Ipomoea triloba]|uniref:uncharacterized protein LOC116001125 n=1 Tax=Ipomoea triloba TaxID=35885 RepID=UPI00125E02FB|nr:uncharacterized protein LOC116001125 [Ipomoea triloba]